VCMCLHKNIGLLQVGVGIVYRHFAIEG